MPLNDIGPRGFHQASAVATLNFTPQFDRAAVIRRVLIDKVSAGDTWRVKVQGREVAAFDIQTVGNQQPLSGPYSGYPRTNDIFEIAEKYLGIPLIYPVPLGQTATIASDAGATANISIIFTEYAPNEITLGMLNHPQGNRMLVPIVFYKNANVTTAGENTFDTQIAPSWFPNISVDGQIPPNWVFRVLAMFLDGGGVNTFSGAANHQSNTTYMAVFRNGQRLYTRDLTGGIPIIGQASAAGSANTVIGLDEGPYPPLQEVETLDWSLLDVPLVFGQGDEYQLRLNIAGDVTGGAGYGTIRQMFLADVRNPGV